MNIFIVDDHPLMREAIVMLVRRISPQSTIVELDRMAVIEAAVAEHGMPDLISLDLKLPDTHGVSGVRELKSKYKNIPVVVLSSSPASEYEDLAMEAGADGYIEKSAGATEISSMLRSFLMLDTDQDAEAGPGKLSKRQKQLLILLDQGLSNREIAEKLGISEHTVKVHLWRLFRRLDVKSRTQATHWARGQGFI